MRDLADVHLHLEGAIPPEVVSRIARRHGHPFGDEEIFERRRSSVRNAGDFLALYAEVCRALRSPEDYAEATEGALRALASSGLAYAEVYVSPAIWQRLRLPVEEVWRAVDRAAEEAFDQGTLEGGLLLDVVRQFGPAAAGGVLDLYERHPTPRIVGFGMGGDERAEPAEGFAPLYARARALGLRTSVHAGEWGGASSLREALDCLRPDRIDHGIAAVEDLELVARLKGEGVAVLVSVSSNLVTGAVESLARHPLPRMLEAGLRVALSADDPTLFSTSTAAEYSQAREAFALSEQTLREMMRNAWRAAFCSEERRQRGLREVAPASTSS